MTEVEISDQPARGGFDEAVVTRVAAACELHLGHGGWVVERLAGGHSGLTLVVTRASNGEPLQRLVVKSAPVGRPSVGRHDVLRHARILRALDGVDGVRVPAVVFIETESPPCFAMEWIGGESIEPVFDRSTAPPPQVRLRSADAARMLAALHKLQADHSNLGSEPEIGPAEELHRWRKTMAAARLSEGRAEVAQLEERLARNAPDPMPAVVVHGDYRLGNAICAGPSVEALIDWEIWSLGDPRVDLAWLRMFGDLDLFPGFNIDPAAVANADRLLDSYEEAEHGRVRSIAWFDALASYKLAAILGHNLRRHLEGRYHDPDQERMAPSIGPLIERALRLTA